MVVRDKLFFFVHFVLKLRISYVDVYIIAIGVLDVYIYVNVLTLFLR
jgi:hypothetical protein